MKIIIYLCTFLGAWMATTAKAELIVLAAPSSGDAYYAQVMEDSFAFHVAYAKQIQNRDDVSILADEGNYDRYVQALGEYRVALAPMLDIWMRDFTTANPVAPVMFRYTAEGQGGDRRGQTQADTVQETLAILAEKAGLTFRESDLLNDGGNFVDDYAGNVVISR